MEVKVKDLSHKIEFGKQGLRVPAGMRSAMERKFEEEQVRGRQMRGGGARGSLGLGRKELA